MPRLPLLLALGLAASGTFSACDSAGHDHDEGEVITRVTYTLVPVTGGGAAQTATFNDANRNGLVEAGEATGLALVAGQRYTGTVAVFGPSGDVTAEVAAESSEHAFVYTPAGGVAGRLAVLSNDLDANGLPFRRTTAVSATGTAAASGTLLVELVHFGSAAAKRDVAGVPSATMERDVSVSFPVTITAAPN